MPYLGCLLRSTKDRTRRLILSLSLMLERKTGVKEIHLSQQRVRPGNGRRLVRASGSAAAGGDAAGASER